jgi:hypothetical protein
MHSKHSIAAGAAIGPARSSAARPTPTRALKPPPEPSAIFEGTDLKKVDERIPQNVHQSRIFSNFVSARSHPPEFVNASHAVPKVSDGRQPSWV